MVQAHRTLKHGRAHAGDDDLLVTGSYSLEQKITVEWEIPVAVATLVALAQRLPDRPYSSDEVRNFMSGLFRSLDQGLPDTKISDYRISPQSFDAILVVLEEHGTLRRCADGNDATWRPG